MRSQIQKNEGVFSSLSRNFDQTVEEINSADEKSTSSTSSTDSSNSADEKSTYLNFLTLPPPQPTPLTVLMKKAHPQPTPRNSADEKSTASNVPIAAIESSNLISSNSTTTDDLGKNNQTDFDK